MSLTLTVGWWIAPVLFTAVVFGAAILKSNSYGRTAGSYTPSGAAIVGMVLLPCAATASALAWLVWALLS